ncbi:hypothetical protein ES708_19492 [subsurface metagenome]
MDGNVYNTQYDFNEATGNLMSRSDILNGQTELFGYDDANRLETWTINETNTYTTSYYQNGNIKSKTDLGNYTYQPDRPHAVTQIEETSEFSTDLQEIFYTNFNKIDYITEGIHRLNFQYGPDNSRKITEHINSGVPERTKYYAGGGYEKEIDHQTGEEREWYYMGGPDGLAAIYEKTGTSEQMYYIHGDHLGSPSVITDEAGAVVARYSFDPWGRQRNPYDWNDNLTITPLKFSRGFTGHEHLDEFALIHMNGRVYDPVIGRMLSPDNYVSYPFNSQNYNRYSYALNNPLTFTDPDGDHPMALLAAGVFIWAGGKVLQTEAMYGNIAPGWGYVGTGMQIGGGMMMIAAMPNPVMTGAMTFSTTIMNGGSTKNALKNGSIALVISAAPEILGFIGTEAGKLELFKGPQKTIKEPLSSSINRRFNFDFDRVLKIAEGSSTNLASAYATLASFDDVAANGGDYYGYVEGSYDFSKKYWRFGFNEGLGINATFHVAGRVNVYQSNGEYMVDAYLSAAGAPTKMNTVWYGKVQVYDGKELVGTLDLRQIPNNDITSRTEIGRTTFNLPTDLGKDVYIKFNFGYSILNPEGSHPITSGSYKFRVNRYYQGFIY